MEYEDHQSYWQPYMTGKARGKEKQQQQLNLSQSAYISPPPSAVLSSVASNSFARPSSSSLSSISSHRSAIVAVSAMRSSRVSARWRCVCCASCSCSEVSRTMSSSRSTAACSRLLASVAETTMCHFNLTTIPNILFVLYLH